MEQNLSSAERNVNSGFYIKWKKSFTNEGKIRLSSDEGKQRVFIASLTVLREIANGSKAKGKCSQKETGNFRYEEKTIEMINI